MVTRRLPRARRIPGSSILGAIAALALVGAGCSSSESDAPAHLVVRTASGDVTDVTGTTWSVCNANEPSAGMSRLKSASFGAGAFAATEVVFTASVDCTGATDPAQGRNATAQAAAQGERQVGWDQGAPAGVPATVTATAVLLSGFTPAGIPDLKTLVLVNDLASPATLHMGSDAAVAPDGYPTSLQTAGRQRTAP